MFKCQFSINIVLIWVDRACATKKLVVIALLFHNVYGTCVLYSSIVPNADLYTFMLVVFSPG